MRVLFQRLIALRHIAIGGALIGLGTGFFWSVVVSLFSLDHHFTGTELILSLAVPGTVGLGIWKTLKLRFWITVPLAYLTLLIPLFGLGIGGANTLQMTIGGVIGGICWSIPFILYYFLNGLHHEKTIEYFHKAGKTGSTSHDSS